MKSTSDAVWKAARWLDNKDGNICALNRFVALGGVADEGHRHACEAQCKETLNRYNHSRRTREELKWLIDFFAKPGLWRWLFS